MHFVFNRWEPLKVRYVFSLLVLVPALLSCIIIPQPQFGVFKGLALAFGGYYAALCTSIALYRLSPFHPMARYPGPILARVSKLYMVFMVVRKEKSYEWFQEQHRKYGDVVRTGEPFASARVIIRWLNTCCVSPGPNEVSICNVDAVLPMMGSQGMPKGPSKYIMFSFYLSLRLT